jgi:F-type H+-transporting ATPase subunit epsilon
VTDLNLEIVTPFGQTYSEKVKSCTVPGALGKFQVLKDHASMLSLVNVGLIKIVEDSGKIRNLSTSGGFCEIDKNEIQIIVESAEFSDTIDVKRAKDAKERAEKRLQSKTTEIDEERAKLALVRALNRLKIAQLR